MKRLGNLGSNLLALMHIMLKPYQLLAFREPFWFLFAEMLLNKEKFQRLWKNSLIVEKSLDCGKSPWLWKVSLMVGNFLDCRKIPWSKNFSLTAEKLFSWLQEVIGLIILKRIRHLFWI